MAKYFGFKPSVALQQKIDKLKAHEASGAEKLYEARDDMLLHLVDEQIDQVLTSLVNMLPDGDKKKTLEKTTGIVKSAASTLLKQLLGKASNDEVANSMDFINNKGLINDPDGNLRVSFTIPDALYSRMQTLFTEVDSGNGEARRKDIEVFFNDFTDENLRHYILDFASTLNLGFIKRKAVPIAESAISKGVKIGNKQLIPKLGQEELEKVANHFKPLFFEI